MAPRNRSRSSTTPADTGLSDDIPVRELARAIPADTFRQGVVAIYRKQDMRSATEDRGAQRIHTFQLGNDFAAKRFAIWGSVQLDQKLKEVDYGTIVFLQYLGKATGERGQHQWTVRRFSGSKEQLAKLVNEYRAGCETVALATEAPRQSRSRADGAPPHDDDDYVPF